MPLVGRAHLVGASHWPILMVFALFEEPSTLKAALFLRVFFLNLARVSDFMSAVTQHGLETPKEKRGKSYNFLLTPRIDWAKPCMI